MPGPDPKHTSVRARVNRASTRAYLVDPIDPSIPKLPTRYGPSRISEKTGRVLAPLVQKWHPDTRAWWREIHESPMSTEWHTSDEWGLKRLAVLVDKFNWTGCTATHAEIRVAQKDYGLTPLDRRRLEWTIESTKKAQAEGRKREAATPVTSPALQAVPNPQASDPRFAADIA